MANVDPVDFDTSRIRKRIERIRGSFNTKSPEFKKAILSIGLMLENRMILQYRQKGPRVITGRLINSLRHEIKESKDIITIIAGSFGVPYAPVHEFGGTFNIQGHTRKAHSRTVKGQVQQVREHFVGAHSRTYTARPFVRPAFQASRGDIINILRSLRSK